MTRRNTGESEFEWDEVKATINLKKHMISFKRARKIFRDPDAFIVKAHDGEDGEERQKATGRIEGKDPVITVIFTMRNNGATKRLISARRARDKEEMAYDYNKMQPR